MKELTKAASNISLSSSPPSSVALAEIEIAKKLLVALGDSIPFGFNLSESNQSPAKTAYPYLIGHEGDLHVRNLGVPGLKTDQLLAALQTDQQYRQAISLSDYIAVTIGNNDLLDLLRIAGVKSKGNHVLFQRLLQRKLSRSEIFSNIAKIIIEIRSLTTSPMVLYNTYNPFQSNDPQHHIGNTVLPQINAAFDGLAASYNDVYIADAGNAFSNNQAECVLEGDIHPTNAGQKILAELGLKALNMK